MTEATCKHGATEPHGEIGKDWCAGPPRSWMFEAFRPQLEDQMNLDTEMFTRFDKRVPDAPEVWAVHPHSPLLHIPGDRSARWSNTDPVDNIIAGVRYAMKRHAQPWTDILSNFVPLGWYSSWGEHWYPDPTAPLHVRDWGGEVSFDGEHWTNVRDIGTPIYDTLAAERGDPQYY